MTTISRNLGNDLLPKRKKLGFFQQLGKQWQLVVMSVPMLLYVLFFNYYPLWGWINAFKDISPSNPQKINTLIPYLRTGQAAFCGLDNFKLLFTDNNIPSFSQSIVNTLAMSLINLVFGTLAAILLAILLNEVRQKTFKRTVQTVTYLPHFLSMIIVVGMAQILFLDSDNGTINQLLMSLGVIEKRVDWLGDRRYFWWLVGLINIWKEVGWGTIIYISAMTGIDPCLYEAASIDGAGRMQRIIHVTLPGIRSTFVILLIMNIGHILDTGFEIQYLLQTPGTMEVASTVDLYVMQHGTQNQDLGLATAAGIFKSVIAIFLLTGANFISKRLGEDSLM
jgi:putative aldouronate transport system permease protein